jgi:hypothetical protein
MLSFCLSKLRRRTSGAKNAGNKNAGAKNAGNKHAGKRTSNRPPDAGDGARQYERSISLAELIAASAFLDFGGMVDERWLSGRDRKETGTGRK